MLRTVLSFFDSFALLVVGCVFVSVPTSSASPRLSESNSLKPLSAKEAIEYVEVIDPNVRGITAWGRPAVFKWSGDRSKFAIITRHANVETGCNVYRIVVYYHADLQEIAPGQSGSAGDAGQIVLRAVTGVTSDAISQMRWLDDNETLVFIANEQSLSTTDLQSCEVEPSGFSDANNQVFSLNVVDGVLRKLTSHERSVVAFEMNSISGRLLYVSSEPMLGRGYGKVDYVVDTTMLQEHLQPSQLERTSPTRPRFSFFAVELGEDISPSRIGVPFFHNPYNWADVREMWMSPDGQRVVVVQSELRHRTDWLDRFPALANKWGAFSDLDSYTTDANGVGVPVWEYNQIDLKHGFIESLFKSPTGLYISGDQLQVIWLDEGRRAILTNTFVDPNAEGCSRACAKHHDPQTVEYDFETGEISSIIAHSDPADLFSSGAWSAHYSRTPSGAEILRVIPANGTSSMVCFAKMGSLWKSVDPGMPYVEPCESAVSVSRNISELFVEQSLNSPPELSIKFATESNAVQFTNLNPGLAEYTFGNVEEIEWNAGDEVWKAGIVYPPTFDPARTYPLVIQTHGYSSEQFLVEGPNMTGPYAAQALANRDIVVVQMPDSPEGSVVPLSSKRFALTNAIDALIAQLAHDQIVDPTKVGLIGFSATGHQVFYTLQASRYPIAAATIADAFSINFLGYTAFFGAPYGGMPFIESFYGGASPWGATLQKWTALDASMNLDKVGTPIRLEEYENMIKWWPSYAILRRLQKPVEWISVPYGTHSLVNPKQRQAIQQGNVDWFDFWLNGRERTEPYPGTQETVESLEEQYTRWRKLKGLQPASKVAAQEARAWYKTELARRAATDQWLGSSEGKLAVEQAMLNAVTEESEWLGDLATED